jgi:hypothetical protein
MDRNLIERDVRFLKRYALATTLVLSAMLMVAFTRQTPATPVVPAQSQGKAKFDEIDVQRINIIEPDGTLRLVLSNNARSQGPLYKGKPFFYTGTERPRAGMIFFSEEGTEVGGLIYSGKQLGDTGYSALGHLSFDQYNQDQVFVIQYADRNGKRRMGFQVSDRHNTNIFEWGHLRDSLRKLPDGPVKTEALRKLNAGDPGDPRVAERVYVGRDTMKSAIVKLGDRTGKPRLQLLVDSLGAARVEFLDADGRVTYTLRAPQGADSRRN